VSRIPVDAVRLMNGFRGYQLVVAACRLGIPDIVAASPAGASEVAERTQTDPTAMRRFLRGLAAWGFLAENGDGRYASTDISDAFRSDRPGLRNMALMLNDEAYVIWAELEYSLRTGRPAFDHIHGRSRWEVLADHPEEAALFNAAMVETTARVARDFAAAYDFDAATTVMDVGGGTGALLAAVLRAHPRLRGVVLDLPSGLAGAARAMEAAGVSDRARLVEGSFFAPLPERADVYLLKSIVHDWDDERATQILRCCRDAMVRESRLVIIERVVPERVTGDGTEVGSVMSDLHMMVLLGGRERTTAEYAALLESAGLRLSRTIELPSEFHAVEARPA
jgi:orsellinic acid C2-O-methyltransferase